jgi:hypothetical protein
MDPDQDLLDELERRESGGATAATWLIAAMSLLAGTFGYFTLRLELHSSREASLDGGILIAIGAGVLLLAAYRRLGHR